MTPPIRELYIKLHSWQCRGLDANPVVIEVLRLRGLSQLVITGLADSWLRESRDKIRALVGRWTSWGPLDRLLVQLLPAEESKNGAHLEFPIAVACLSLLAQPPLPPRAREFLATKRLVGSLSLGGELESTEASRFLEQSSPQETLGPSRIQSLGEFWQLLNENPEELFAKTLLPINESSLTHDSPSQPEIHSHPEVHRSQRFLLLAAAIADVPVLLSGPPGVGKSFLARWAAQCVPHPEGDTRQQVQRIWAMTGSRPPHEAPILQPHSRTHLAEFIGYSERGIHKPGIFSLAHGGTLILDEVPELSRDCREILRNVLDQRLVYRRSREASISWPARFWLLATANPCPCGYLKGQDESRCRCPVSMRTAYQARLSGPLKDRFGLRLFLNDQGGSSSTNQSPFGDLSVVDRPAHEIRAIIHQGRQQMSLQQLSLQESLHSTESPRRHDLTQKLAAGLCSLMKVEHSEATMILKFAQILEHKNY